VDRKVGIYRCRAQISECLPRTHPVCSQLRVERRVIRIHMSDR